MTIERGRGDCKAAALSRLGALPAKRTTSFISQKKALSYAFAWITEARQERGLQTKSLRL